jgi:4-aminobutyrate aminotransferase
MTPSQTASRAETAAQPGVGPRHEGELLPEIKGPLPGPKAKALIERDNRVMSPSYTRDYPFAMARGRGSVVWDPDGNRFLDLAAGIAVCSTGHSHPKVLEAIKTQAESFLHMSGTDFYYESQVRLAERLTAAAPLNNKTQGKAFFTNSGTEAVEGALKLAKYRTRRPNIVSFYGAFHGRTHGSMSVTASKAVQKAHFGPLLPNIYHINYCSPTRCRAPECREANGCALGLMKELDQLTSRVCAPDTIAAILVEPIQGEGGYVVPSNEWLAAIRAFCDKHGVMMICDEVQSGMGRTGALFAIEATGVKPDIITLAKGIASGLPLGAILADEKVMTWPYGSHASTFGGNPVACAAANATMDLLEGELMANARDVGAHLKSRLEKVAATTPLVCDVRGRGLMIGVEISKADGSPNAELRNKLVMDFFDAGVLILGCGANTIRFAPPLCLTKAQADFAVDVFAKLMAKAA